MYKVNNIFQRGRWGIHGYAGPQGQVAGGIAGCKTIIEPKALDMLGTVFNEDNSGTVNDMQGLVPMPGLEKIESFTDSVE